MPFHDSPNLLILGNDIFDPDVVLLFSIELIDTHNLHRTIPLDLLPQGLFCFLLDLYD